MRRVGFAGVSALFCIVFLLLSCDINPMDTEIERGTVANPDHEGLEYLTVTYHSEGHTSGEVPVDPTRYPVPRRNFNVIPPMTVVHAETAIILGPGTLEKEGHVFAGWAVRNTEGFSDNLWCAVNGWVQIVPPGLVLHFVHDNLDLHALWTPVTNQ